MGRSSSCQFNSAKLDKCTINLKTRKNLVFYEIVFFAVDNFFSLSVTRVMIIVWHTSHIDHFQCLGIKRREKRNKSQISRIATLFLSYEWGNSIGMVRKTNDSWPQALNDDDRWIGGRDEMKIIFDTNTKKNCICSSPQKCTVKKMCEKWSHFENKTEIFFFEGKSSLVSCPHIHRFFEPTKSSVRWRTTKT
jgi:hypothetical protein